MVVTLGALGTLRAIADLTTSLRLREVAHAHDVLRLSPEREAGVAGYSAGMSDYPATQSQSRGARHRADEAASTTSTTAGSARAAQADGATPGGAHADADGTHAAGQSPSFHDEVLRTTADLDTRIAEAGVTGTGTAHHRVPETLPAVPDTPEGVAVSASAAHEEPVLASDDHHRP